MDDEINYRRINQLLRDDNAINAMIEFINTGRVNYPANVNQNNYLQKSNLFYIADGNLFFINPNREYVRSTDINNRLTILYNDKLTGLNKSIQTFYYLVKSRYLNITRSRCGLFLKSQQIYNISRPLKKTIPYALQTYKAPRQMYVMDYIYVTNIYQRQGQNQLYIFNVTDVFSKFVFLFATTNIQDNTTIQCLQQIINNGYAPKVITADNGFKQTIKTFLERQQPPIKLLYNPSHVPVKHIESSNRTVRRYLRELILRNYRIPNMRWNWANEINIIQNAINGTKSSVTKKTPNELFFAADQTINNQDFRNVVTNINRQKEEKIRPHLNDNIFQVGDPVHLLLTTVYRDMRKKKKEEDLKNLPVLWTPEIYFIHRVYHARNRLGMPTYSIRNNEGLLLRKDFLNNNQNLAIVKLKHTELLDASREEEQIYNNQDAIRINKIRNPQAYPIQFR